MADRHDVISKRFLSELEEPPTAESFIVVTDNTFNEGRKGSEKHRLLRLGPGAMNDIAYAFRYIVG
ncbi:hypothetical protein ASG48_04720 [Aurantimonas sp. Leaf443]|nr:hypothetical protein ASG48_04720 [Aurantimonas sp. Leaf443]